MSVRFVIRRVDTGTHRWALWDALCPNCEHHNFHDRYWADECTGRCDTFKFFSSAIGTASAPD